MFKDHFSGHAAGYSRYRPLYPPAVFRWLSEQPPRRECAWDAATGNGQAAARLTDHFDTVIATDASSEQIKRAQPHPQIRYEVARSEDAPIEERSVDLILVAQALHWFDLPSFYDEVRRVCRPGAVLAAMSYGLFEISPAADAIIRQLYEVALVSDWPPERVQVDQCYQHLPFPFDELRSPRFEMRARWNLDQLLGYLRTWSAVVRHVNRTGIDPVAEIRESLADAWDDAAASRPIRWPLSLRVGRVSA